MMVNAVEVKFIKRQHLYQKAYVFTIRSRKDAVKLKKGQIVFVKSINGGSAPVVVEKLLDLPEEELRQHASILPVRKIRFYDPNKPYKSKKKTTKKSKPRKAPRAKTAKRGFRRPHRHHLLRHVKIVLKKK